MNKKIEKFFKEITGFNPYSFQLAAIKSIIEGKSIILRAPTGSGKSEAILMPFLFLYAQNLTGKTFPNQLIYSLPMRVLVNNLGDRFKNYCKKIKNLKIAIHHGENPESELFLEDIIVSTIDQTVGAYCCVPLSMSLRSGNIPAGSVSSAFLVFDEVHTYNPDFALQSILVLLEHSSILKIPFAIISATLPDSFLEYIRKEFENVEIIDVKDESEIHLRKPREIILNYNFDFSLENYLSKNDLPTDKKIIIVCNTVKRAQEIFEELSNKYKNVFLIHSQFIPKHREEKEKKINEIFGKNSEIKSGILVTTQVIEVGMDISCDLMISELAPIDSLIQRAGRIARWGGRGELIITGLDAYEKNPYSPYEKEICLQTVTELNKLKKPSRFNWNLEKKLVNKVLNSYFKKYLDSSRKAEVLNFLTKAAFEGDKNLVEFAVRGEELTCQISIHKNPESLGDKIFELPRINVNFFKLKNFFEEYSKKFKTNFIWEIVEENLLSDETIARFKPRPAENIKPYKFYIISSNFIKYSRETGLIFEVGKSDNFEPEKRKSLEEKETNIVYKRELWKNHALKTLYIFEENFLSRNKYIFEKLALAWGIPNEELLKYLRFAIVFHDLGKLSVDWQKRIYKIEGEKLDVNKPLAHSSKSEYIGIPHATIGASVAKNILENFELKQEIKRAIVYSIAHHHSPRVHEVYSCKPIPSFMEIIKEMMNKIGVNFKQDKMLVNSVWKLKNLSQFPSIRDGLYYRTYAIFVRFLRLSDRESVKNNFH